MSRLTTHVLDLTSGRPAAGLAVVLSRLDGPTAEPVARATTNADGRTDAPLLEGSALVPGRYELAFAVGDWFAAQGGATPGSTAGSPEGLRYLDVVPVHFGVAPDGDHLHVALLVTPWSYTTYRGS
jgi:5-hydroxyisourate hydrolase